ncbi:MAG TPA: hypothetical protein VEC06_04975 [Paucimonas sp.]|nr:hypothetical protein [Paucimonas sp.]
MRHFHITARTERAVYSYGADAYSSFDVLDAAIDRFGLCAVTVRPAS